MRKSLPIRGFIASVALAGLWLAWSQNPPPAQLTWISYGHPVPSSSAAASGVMPTTPGHSGDDKFAQDCRRSWRR